MAWSQQPTEATKKWCAVTGGRGFMARHLVAALLRSGEYCVRVADLAPAIDLGRGETEEVLGDGLRDGRAVYLQADVCNLDQLIKTFEGVDVVFHTAAPNPLKNNLQLHYKVNVEGTKNVIDACTVCKVKRLVYTSSSGVVFDGIHELFDINESLPYPDKFHSAYTRTKAEAEKMVLKANNTNELLTCCLRPGPIFGPGDLIVPAVHGFGKTLIILGDGENNDDFVYVENLVHGHICADKTLSTEEGARTSGGKAYFITNMEPMNFWDFQCMIFEEFGCKRLLKIRIPLLVCIPLSYVLEWGYKVLRHFGVPEPQQLTPTMIKYATLNRTFSCTRAVKDLGYQPLVTLKEGVKIAVQSYNH